MKEKYQHFHKPIFEKIYNPGEDFEFHPKLREWLIQYWSLDMMDRIVIREIGCDSTSCPIYETIVMAYSPESDSPRILKFGRSKHQITKFDVVLSTRKQNLSR